MKAYVLAWGSTPWPRTFIYAVLSLGLLSACEGPRPSDEQLIKDFREHREEIDKLISMMRADKVLLRVDDNWTDPADPTSVGISPDRIATYRRILDDAGIRRGFYYDPETGGVTFVAWATGLVTGGASKSIMFMPESPTPLVQDLDAFKPSSKSAVAFRHLEGPWYLEADWQ